jgi:hypothetical protein
MRQRGLVNSATGGFSTKAPNSQPLRVQNAVGERQMISGRMNVLKQNFWKNVLPIWVAARLVG